MNKGGIKFYKLHLKSWKNISLPSILLLMFYVWAIHVQPAICLQIIISPEDKTIVKEVNGQPCLIGYRDKAEGKINLSEKIAPESVIAISKQYLIRNFGESYYNKHLKFIDSEIYFPRVKNAKEKRYRVRYTYEITINDYRTVITVSTHHNSTGKIIDSSGVVDRVTNPSLGMPFDMDYVQAVLIAQKEGLEPGIRPWEVRFLYRHDIKHYRSALSSRYIWNIVNYLSKDIGRIISIDPVTKTVEKTGWMAEE